MINMACISTIPVLMRVIKLDCFTEYKDSCDANKTYSPLTKSLFVAVGTSET